MEEKNVQGDTYISDQSVLSGSNIPSSPEVTVRTMASDLASITAGGGSAPRGEAIQGNAIFSSSTPKIREHSRGLLLILIILGALIVVGISIFIGYSLLRPFFERPPVVAPIEKPVPDPTEIFQ